MQHNLSAIFLSTFCGSRAFRQHLDLEGGRECERRYQLQLTKGPRNTQFYLHPRTPSVFAGSQTVCFDPCADPVMNKTSGCGPDAAQRDRRRAAAKPCRATISSHTLTSEASQHQNHGSVTTSVTHGANPHNVFLCQIDKI